MTVCRYWDWAADSTQSRIPDVLSTTSISVTKPGSDGSETHTNIPNPLYDYRFLKPQPPESASSLTTVLYVLVHKLTCYNTAP